MNDVDRAEREQAWKAFLIPSSLFVACLCNAAGIYIIYAGNSVGVFFIGLGIAIIAAGLFAFCTFHNKKRAAGQWKKAPVDVRTEGSEEPEDLTFEQLEARYGADREESAEERTPETAGV